MAVHPSDPALATPAYDEDYYDPTNPHPESITRLAAQHTTEGYRDGITASKQEFIQEGFDEGYILGAALGLKIGELIGALDGLVGSVNGLLGKDGKGGGEDKGKEREKLVNLLKEQKKIRDTAREELKLEKVFGKEYFGEDGIWKWTTTGGEDETFNDIVLQHPLVVKWRGIVKTQAGKLGLELKDDKDAGENEEDDG
ncbi:hypothetical protein ABW19_dt0210252 [Dactylella cylindrospora]|nr:hypothetical protein ABW19_dt0210252 [Dactylella cylindrospora]